MNKLYTFIFGILSALPFGALQAQEITVKQATQEALEKNPDLKAAIAEKKRAGFGVEVEENRFTTNLAAETKYGHQLNANIGGADSMIFTSEATKILPFGTQLSAGVNLNYTTPDAADSSTGVGVTLSAVQPLMQGFGADINKASLYAAQFEQEAANSELDSTMSALLRDVLGAYWELWYAQQAVKIQEHSLETIQAQLKEAQIRIDAGALAPAGTLSLKTEEASIEEQLANARADVAVRSLNLATLLGRGANTTLEASDTPPTLEALPTKSELFSRVEAASFELKSLSASIDIADLNLRTTKDQKRAKLNAIGQLQLSTSTGDDLTSGPEAAGFLGLRLETPASQAGLRAEESRAILAVGVAQDRFDASRARITQQVSTQVEQLNTGTQRLALSEKTAALAAQSVDAEKARFDAGVSTATELIRVQQQEREANLRVLRIQVDLIVARLALDHLTGDLLAKAETI
jgi:outer membrane protein